MDSDSLPAQGVGRLPGPLSDQLWWHLKNSETPSMGLVEGEILLTWFLTTALLSKPEANVTSVYRWSGHTAEAGLEIGPVRSSETTNNLGRTSSVSMRLST